MTTLCIIPCGSKKIWDKDPQAGPTKAKFVYIGPFAKKCREYAEKFYPSSWCILSAKYGFLFPDDIVPGPYNISFNNKKTNPIGTAALMKQAPKKKMHLFDKVVVLGGKNYCLMAREVFSFSHISTPLSDCKGIGYMMGKLKDAILSDNEL